MPISFLRSHSSVNLARDARVDHFLSISPKNAKNCLRVAGESKSNEYSKNFLAKICSFFDQK